MVLSMTAFGRAPIDGTPYVIEIQSINKKGLDIALSFPREFSLFETEARAEVATLIQRGQVTVKIFGKKSSNAGPLSLERCKAAYLELSQIARETSPTLQITFRDVMDFLLHAEEEIVSLSHLKEALAKALDAFMEMKRVEGNHLRLALLENIHLIEKGLSILEGGSGEVVKRYEIKILERLKEVKELTPEDRDRVLREVVIYADRLDITEEIVRFRSHIAQVRELLQGKGASIGRTLEFLIQEKGREANTMGAKSGEIEMTREIIVIKGEIEKMRQQVQNIE